MEHLIHYPELWNTWNGVLLLCTSNDSEQHDGDTCPVHEGMFFDPRKVQVSGTCVPGKLVRTVKK